jgi:hypothetical protein
MSQGQKWAENLFHRQVTQGGFSPPWGQDLLGWSLISDRIAALLMSTIVHRLQVLEAIPALSRLSFTD